MAFLFKFFQSMSRLDGPVLPKPTFLMCRINLKSFPCLSFSNPSWLCLHAPVLLVLITIAGKLFVGLCVCVGAFTCCDRSPQLSARFVAVSIDGEARRERLVSVFTAPTPPPPSPALTSDLNRVEFKGK